MHWVQFYDVTLQARQYEEVHGRHVLPLLKYFGAQVTHEEAVEQLMQLDMHGRH
jgi:hypothetical protein